MHGRETFKETLFLVTGKSNVNSVMMLLTVSYGCLALVVNYLACASQNHTYKAEQSRGEDANILSVFVYRTVNLDIIKYLYDFCENKLQSHMDTVTNTKPNCVHPTTQLAWERSSLAPLDLSRQVLAQHGI